MRLSIEKILTRESRWFERGMKEATESQPQEMEAGMHFMIMDLQYFWNALLHVFPTATLLSLRWAVHKFKC